MNSETTTQAMPHAPAAEKSLLSALMAGKAFLSRAVSEGVTSETFYLPAHRTVWESLVEAQGKFHTTTDDNPGAESFDLAAFAQQLALDGLLERIGGPFVLGDIYGHAVTTGAWSVWIGQLRETEAHRQALRLATRLSEASDATDAVEVAETAIRALRRTLAGARRAIPAKDATAAFLAQFKRDHEAGDIPGASTGIFAIDAISGGMRPGELWVVGGRPSRGKSVLMMQHAAAFVLEGKTVAYFTLEMMANEIIARFISHIGRVNLSALTQPRTATKADLGGIGRAAKTMIGSLLHIDDSPARIPTPLPPRLAGYGI